LNVILDILHCVEFVKKKNTPTAKNKLTWQCMVFII